MKSYLEKAFQENHLENYNNIIPELVAYLDLMQRWNQVYNLTAIKDEQELVLLHIIDSLSVNAFLHGNKIIDVGTGAGLPGIPLALTNPDRQFYLLDSNGKKTRFLTQVMLELKMKNVVVINERVENYQPEFCFDSIITRAFAPLKNMLQNTKHLLCQDGELLAMKGTYPEEELKDLPKEFTVHKVHQLEIKGLNAQRHLVCIRSTNA
jgi:16S rRNA (guanine527-N7)-methyltransferase